MCHFWQVLVLYKALLYTFLYRKDPNSTKHEYIPVHFDMRDNIQNCVYTCPILTRAILHKIDFTRVSLHTCHTVQNEVYMCFILTCVLHSKVCWYTCAYLLVSEITKYKFFGTHVHIFTSYLVTHFHFSRCRAVKILSGHVFPGTIDCLKFDFLLCTTADSFRFVQGLCTVIL